MYLVERSVTISCKRLFLKPSVLWLKRRYPSATCLPVLCSVLPERRAAGGHGASRYVYICAVQNGQTNETSVTHSNNTARKMNGSCQQHTHVHSTPFARTVSNVHLNHTLPLFVKVHFNIILLTWFQTESSTVQRARQKAPYSVWITVHNVYFIQRIV